MKTSRGLSQSSLQRRRWELVTSGTETSPVHLKAHSRRVAALDGAGQAVDQGLDGAVALVVRLRGRLCAELAYTTRGTSANYDLLTSVLS